MTLQGPFFLTTAMVACGGLSWLLTGAVRRVAIAHNVIDVPNERSSHTIATPRGGGIAIVATFLLALVGLLLGGTVPANLAWALLGGGILIAAVGLADDRWGLPARWRFMAHLGSAVWVLALVGPFPRISAFGFEVSNAWILLPSMAVLITWSINLFNFMDGIDGIASVEALCVTVGGAIVALVAGRYTDLVLPLLLASCVGGFLIWNFPPARIFMGDAGSGFLGFLIAALAIWYAREEPALFWAWLILYGCFFVDATVTLVRRVRRGEKFYEAHRSHAYQYASRRLGRHLPVTLATGALSLGWLLPVAMLVASGWLDGAWGLLIAYSPLVLLAVKLRAGDRAAQER